MRNMIYLLRQQRDGASQRRAKAMAIAMKEQEGHDETGGIQDETMSLTDYAQVAM